MHNFKRVSVIVPVYNEERTVQELLQQVKAVVLPKGLAKEIIVVNDGSTDNTPAILKEFAKDNGVKVIEQPNAGKASALMRGFNEASGDILLVQDADLEYNPSQYPQLLAPILNGEARVVYGSRFLGKIEDMKFINRAANCISNWTMRLLWGTAITDINTCYKVFVKSAIEGIDIVSTHFAFETEITVKLLKKGETIVEVPIEYHARTRAQGKKIKWATALQMYWPILKYRFVGNN